MNPLRVEVVHAYPARVLRGELELPPGATGADARAAADLPATMPGVDVDPARIAVYGRLAAPRDRLHDGDRVEILRPLLIDPKQARRQRAAGR